MSEGLRSGKLVLLQVDNLYPVMWHSSFIPGQEVFQNSLLSLRNPTTLQLLTLDHYFLQIKVLKDLGEHF